MPDQDFQDRLQRIAGDAQRGSNASGDGGHRPDLRRLTTGSVLTTFGTYMVALVYLEYGAIRERLGIEWAVGLGLLALATFAFGLALTFRALRRIRARGPVAVAAPVASARPTTLAAPMNTTESRRASGWSRFVTSFLGLVLGIAASACLFISAAARFIETDRAQTFFTLATLVALLLTVVALTIGLVGLFARGFSLWRVPFYFIVGAFFTWVAGYYLRLNLLGWPSFVKMLQ